MAKVKALPLTEATGLAPEHAAWWVANRLASEAADSFYHCANPGVLKLQPAEPLRSGDKIALRLVWTGPSVDGPIPVRWAAVNLEPERPLPETVDSSDDTVIVFERVGRQQVNLLVEAEVGNRVERAAFTDPGVTVKPETPSAR